MIRPYEEQDLDAVLDVYLEASIVGQDFLPAEFWEQGIPEIRDELMPIAETWVVEVQGEIVASLSMMDNLIGGLFTRPAHQGRGYGRALVEKMQQHHDPLLVEVFAANTKAIAFYRNRGFSEVERLLNEESGLPLLIMRSSTASN